MALMALSAIDGFKIYPFVVGVDLLLEGASD